MPSPGPSPDWEQIAEAVPHMAWIGTSTGRPVYVNKLTQNYLGASAALEGLDWLPWVHPADAARARDTWSRAAEGAAAYEMEVRIRRFDGAYRWHTFRASPGSTDGRDSRWIGTIIDIEERRRLERSLLEAVGATEEADADAFLTALHAAAPVALGYVTADLRLGQANEEFAAIEGSPLRAQVGRPVAEALPRLWPQIDSACRRVLETGEAVGNLTFVGDAAGDGHVHEYLASCYPDAGSEKIAGVGIVAADVTALAQATEFRAAALSRVADGVIAVDGDGLVVHMNASARRMTGLHTTEVAGRPLEEFVRLETPDGNAFSAASLVDSAKQGSTTTTLGAVVKADGARFAGTCSLVPIGVGAPATGTVVIFRPLPERQSVDAVIRLVLIEPQAIVADAFELLLRNHSGLDLVGLAAMSAQGVAEVQRLLPDVVLVSADLPDVDGVQTAQSITAVAPDALILLLTKDATDAYVRRALDAGCVAVLDQRDGLDDVVAAVRRACDGQTLVSRRAVTVVLPSGSDERIHGMKFLTPREQEVLACVVQGLTNPAIARELGVSANTVRNHVQRILFKLNVHSKLEAVALTRDGRRTA